MSIFHSPFRAKQERAASFPTALIPTRYTQYPYGPTFAGALVDDYTALSLPAAWRCVNLIADSIASSPMRAFKNDLLLPTQPPLLKRPNNTETRHDTIFSIVVSLLLRGNAYALLGDFDALMYPRQLQVLHPDNVTVVRDAQGVIVYRVCGIEVDPSTLLHIKGFMVPGAITGMGVVQAQREALSHHLSMQEFAQRYFSEGAVPPVAITSADNIEDPEIERLREEWVEKHGRSRKPVILTDGMDVKQLSFTPEDSQFLQSRQFSLTEIGLMFGVDGYWLGAPGDNMTYQNVGQAATNLNKFTLRPWYSRVEQAFSDLLPRGTEVQFNMDAIVRADQLTRYQTYAIALGTPKSTGWLTVDEVRALEGYEPMPPNPEPQPAADNPDVDLDDDDDDSADSNNGPGDSVVAPPAASLTSPTPNASSDGLVNVPAHTRRPPTRK